MKKETVNFSDWEKLELRVAEILEVEEIEGADKLYKLTLDVGKEIGKRIGIYINAVNDLLKGVKRELSINDKK